MSTNLENGVVDENCRFHLLNNLFFAGSSIFPTSGEAILLLQLQILDLD